MIDVLDVSIRIGLGLGLGALAGLERSGVPAMPVCAQRRW
ncbi:hypothetical protein M2432_000963 [Mycobacterium sp. OTB74]|nr:hypothetical protein [Mycobacterium sp. OTB74]